MLSLLPRLPSFSPRLLSLLPGPLGRRLLLGHGGFGGLFGRRLLRLGPTRLLGRLLGFLPRLFGRRLLRLDLPRLLGRRLPRLLSFLPRLLSLLGFRQARLVHADRHQTGTAEHGLQPLGRRRETVPRRRAGPLDDHAHHLPAVVEQRGAVPPLSGQRVVPDGGRAGLGFDPGRLDAADGARPDDGAGVGVEGDAVDGAARFRRVPRERIRHRRRIGGHVQQPQTGGGVVGDALRRDLGAAVEAHHEIRADDAAGVVGDDLGDDMARRVRHEAEQTRARARLARPTDRDHPLRPRRLPRRRKRDRHQEAGRRGPQRRAARRPPRRAARIRRMPHRPPLALHAGHRPPPAAAPGPGPAPAAGRIGRVGLSSSANRRRMVPGRAWR